MPKVLIIEDTDEMRLMLKGYIERIMKYEVIEAVDGLEGIKIAQAQQPDVIILDLMMPVASGDLTLGYIRSTAKLRDIPIIVSSAHTDAHKISKQLGADLCLPKPYDLGELKKAIETLLAKAAEKSKVAETPAAGLTSLAAKLESMKAAKPAEPTKAPEAPRTLDTAKAATLARLGEEAKAAELESQKVAMPVIPAAEPAKPAELPKPPATPPIAADTSKPTVTPPVNETKPAAKPIKPTAPAEPAKPTNPPAAQTPIPAAPATSAPSPSAEPPTR